MEPLSGVIIGSFSLGQTLGTSHTLADADGLGAVSYQWLRAGVANNPIPFSQMVNLAPQNEAQKDVDRWYAQVGSVVGFMIRRGGSFNFSLFLSRLRDGASVDKALEAAYGGLWNDLAAVERAWKLEALN